MGPYTQQQMATLTEFENASRAVVASVKIDGSYGWWVDAANRVKATGLFRDGQEIFRRHFHTPTGRMRRIRQQIFSS